MLFHHISSLFLFPIYIYIYICVCVCVCVCINMCVYILVFLCVCCSLHLILNGPYSLSQQKLWLFINWWTLITLALIEIRVHKYLNKHKIYFPFLFRLFILLYFSLFIFSSVVIIFGYVCSITVIVIGSGLGQPRSNPACGCLCFFFFCKWARKGHEFISFLFTYESNHRTILFTAFAYYVVSCFISF